MTPADARRPALPRALRFLVWCVVIVLLALIVAGFIAAPVAKNVLNKKLAAMTDYTGHVDHVSVSLWRGHVAFRDAVFRKRAEASAPPLAAFDRADFNLAYASLLHGKLRADAVVDHAELNISPKVAKEDAPEAARKAAPKAKRWQEQLRHMLPVELTRLEVSNTKVHFVDESRQPKVDVGLDHLHLLATGLTNQHAENEKLPARVELNAIMTGDGRLRITVQADPLNRQPTFNTQTQLRGLSLPAFNSFLLAYADADVSAGTFEFDSEVQASNGHYQGYVKPFFKDLNFKTASDKNKNAAQLLAKKVVSAAASLLKNDDEQKVATKAPFSGDFENNDVDIWTTVANLLRNAFVQGLREGFEGQKPGT